MITTTTQYIPDRLVPTMTDMWAKRIILKLLGGINHGRIIIEDGLERHVVGDHEGLCARITVRHPGVYKKILLGGSLGAGETYVDNLWEVDDLTALIRIMARNITKVDKMEQGFALLLRPVQLLAHLYRRNNRKQARENIISHYDLGNAMYASFLDPTMMYSAAMYPDDSSSLEEAALHKLETVCRKLNLKPSDRVIEIGSGWGGFALYAAKHYGCHVTTTTISDAQYHEVKKRIAEQGLEKLVTLLNKDYRELSGKYDKLVSIEMIEAVGHEFMPAYFKKCEELLKENGAMLLQAITIVDQKYKQYVNSVDFIQRHIFPGGCLPSIQRMQSVLTNRTDLVVRQLEDFGFDYAKTLKDWRQRFLIALPMLLDKGFDERFRRLWEYYLSYCEGGFRERTISVVQLVASRPENRMEVKL